MANFNAFLQPKYRGINNNLFQAQNINKAYTIKD